MPELPIPSIDSILFLTVGILLLIVGLRIYWVRRRSAAGPPEGSPPVREAGARTVLRQPVPAAPSGVPESSGQASGAAPAGIAPVGGERPSEDGPPQAQGAVAGGSPPEGPVSPGGRISRGEPPGSPVGESGGDSPPAPPSGGGPGKPVEVPSEDPSIWSDQQIIDLVSNYAAPHAVRFRAIRVAGDRQVVAAVPSLIEILYEPDPAVSAAAAESLGRIGDPRAIEPLLEVTRRNDLKLTAAMPQGPGKPEAATEPGAGEQDESPEAVKQQNPFNYKELTVFKIDLLPKEYFQADGTPIPRKELVQRGLKDNDQQLRKMAAKAAIGMRDADLVPVLVDTLKNPYEVESVRYLAAEALGEMEAEAAATPLLDALGDENVAVRYSAASALSNLGGETAVKGLIEALRDENEFVRSQVAFALGKIGDSRALEALFGAVNDQHEGVRFSVAEALGRFPGQPVLQELEARLARADRTMRLALVEVLGQIKDDHAIEILRKVLRDPDTDLSFRASLALMEHKSLDTLDDLIEASRRLDKELMEWLGGEGAGAPIPALAPEGDETTQFKAYSTIGLKKNEEQAAALEKLSVALQHTSPNVRGCAANALGDFRSPAANQLLLTALQDDHEYVRATALASLGKIGDPDVLPSLEKCLSDPSEEVRYAFARMLGSFQDLRAVRFLEDLAAKDASPDVKRVARTGLQAFEAHRGGGGPAS